MSRLHRAIRLADRFLPVGVADAHCDVPCGIYDPRDALQAADTNTASADFVKLIFKVTGNIKRVVLCHGVLHTE